MVDPREGRATERFVAARPIVGSYGSTAMTICDMGEFGVQIEHAGPLKVTTRSRVAFAGVGSQIVELQGTITWSRLCSSPNASGKYLYRSGISVEDPVSVISRTIQQLLARGLLRRDEHSLDKKPGSQLARDRDTARLTIQRSGFTTVTPPPDQMLLIRQARERLRAHPEEAGKWYNRAKHSLSAEESKALDEAGVGPKEDVLAVWEYLEETIGLGAVAKAFLVS